MQSFLFKYIIVGDSSVGKSCLLLRLLDDKFRLDHESTIGVEFGSKTLFLNDKTVKLQIWDTAGQESFKSITRSYYRGSICALVVYDITNKDSFANCEKWLEETKNYSHDKMIIMLIGNKSDLDERREVSQEKASWFAEKNNLLFFETSAKTGNNVEEIFKKSANEILKKIDSKEIDPYSENAGVKIDVPPRILQSQKFDNKKKNCC